MSLSSVCIVLATYNGERFLPEQLRSLSAQTRPPDRVVLRDDGSDDHSVEIARAWSRDCGIDIQLETGPRLGPAQSFLHALRATGPADLYLFCDQDDVWLPNKIERALRVVPCNVGAPPVLYASCAQVVDEQLRFLRLTAAPRRLSFASAACESLLTGCTMAFNTALRERVVRELPAFTPMHDWWLYLVASAMGTLHFDEVPTLLYRQHEHNALGAGRSGWVEWRERLQRAASPDSAVRWRQLRELDRIHGSELKPADADLVQTLLAARDGMTQRMLAACCAEVERQTKSRRMSTRLAILANRF